MASPRYTRRRPLNVRTSVGSRHAATADAQRADQGVDVLGPAVRTEASHARRQLELDAATASPVHRVLGVQSAQRARDLVHVVDDLEPGQAGAQHAADVRRELPVPAAEEQPGPVALAPEAVDGEDDVDVVEELRQRRRALRSDQVRR